MPRLGDRFELVAPLGRGAMGAVFRAQDLATVGREVALKLLAVESSDGLQVERALQRFLREAEVTAALRHPGIVLVHEAGRLEGRAYISYELVEGARSIVQAASALDVPGRALLVRDLARALGHAHARGVVHRDVKPENVLVSREGAVRVVDFGLATATGLERLTRTGTIVGTPAYMAPEQITGAEVGPAADVWATGVILYEALTGARPFGGDALVALAGAICTGSYAAPRTLAPELPVALEAVVARALMVDPVRRYPHGDALAGAIEAALDAPPPRRSRVLVLVLVLVLVFVLGAIAARVASMRVEPTAPVVDAPQVALALEPVPPETTDETCVLRGRTPADAPTLVVRAGSARPRTLAPGAAFAIEVALVPGENVLVVEAHDPATGERVAQHTLRVVRHALPAWFKAAPAERRPSWPLPSGLRVADEPGIYENETDASALVWVAPAGPFMGRHEVTVAQWRAYARATGAVDPNGERPANHPAFYVSQPMAEAYATWAGLRLPTEREWDLAFGDRPFPWGTAEDPARANLSETLGGDGHVETAPVGSFPRGASPCGCLDLMGNVWEWVLPAEALPISGMGMLRGGAWDTKELLPRGRRVEVVNTRALSIWGLRVCR